MMVRTPPLILLGILIRNSVSPKEIQIFFLPWTMTKCPFSFWPQGSSESNLRPNLNRGCHGYIIISVLSYCSTSTF